MAGIAAAVPHAAWWPATLALLCADLGVGLLCLYAARREPGAGHRILAAGAMVGTVALVVAAASGQRPLMLDRDYAWPGALGFFTVLLFVSQRRWHRRALADGARMTSFFVALTKTNQSILRMKDPMALYEEICQVCVGTGHAQMACVYLVDDSPPARLTRVAGSGPAEQFLAGFPNPWDISTPEAKTSYTVRALREDVPMASNDYQHDEGTRPFQDRAREYGVQSVAWLPLRRRNAPVGVLMLTAQDRGFFDPPLMGLLASMADDISFALDNHDREMERIEATRQVQEGLDRFRQLFHAAPVASTIVSVNARRIVDVNQAMCERMQMDREALIGKTTASLGRSVIAEDRENFYAQLHTEGRVRNLIVHGLDEAGQRHLELLNAELIDYMGERCHLMMSLDLSDLRAAEEARAALTEVQAASRAKTDFSRG